MKIRLLPLRPVDIFNYQHQELFAEVTGINPIEEYHIVKPTFTDVVS